MIGRFVSVVIAACIASSALPAAAVAHNGPANPVASSYLAVLRSHPPGTTAHILGGDQRMWLQVSPTETVIVLDNRGAPYLRFTHGGVEVNVNSAMYYLNLPTPLPVPPGLTARTRPAWERASFDHVYNWHDGRLHALSSVALLPGARDVGRWSIPLLVNGAPTVLDGSLLYKDPPSIAWFWPIVVLLLCVLAGWRVRRESLDRWTARVLAVAVLAGVAVAGAGRELYGEPMVTTGQLIVLALILAFVAGELVVVLRGRIGFFPLLLVSVAGMWEGLEFIPALLHGYVFAAIPPFLIRAATVVCLAGSAGVLLLGFRLGDYAAGRSSAPAARRREERAANETTLPGV